MFSQPRTSSITLEDGSSKSDFNIKNWLHIFNELNYILYFKDHLNKHSLSSFNLNIVFSSLLSIESVNLLLLFAKKYNFIKLRTLENKSNIADLESNYLLNTLKSNYSKTDLCLFLNTNTRYENYNVNLKLRQKFLQGGLELFSISSLINYTYPVKFLGSNIKTLKKICSGNHLVCQNFTSSTNPIFY